MSDSGKRAAMFQPDARDIGLTIDEPRKDRFGLPCSPQVDEKHGPGEHDLRTATIGLRHLVQQIDRIDQAPCSGQALRHSENALPVRVLQGRGSIRSGGVVHRA